MQIIRFAILHADTGQAETGANYPGCSEQTPNACQPMTFTNVTEAQAYAQQNGELLYVMGSAMPGTPQWNAFLQQVWKYVLNPNLLPPPAPVPGSALSNLSTPVLLGGAALALYLLL